MSIIRSPKPESFFYIVDKQLSEDKNLSWAARGLLIFLLGKPDNWAVSVEYLITQGDLKRDALHKLLNELITSGYVKREQTRENGRLAGVSYTVYDKPCTVLPHTDFPCTVKPSLISNELKQGLNKNNNISNDAKKADDEVIKNLSRDDSRKNFALQLDWKPNLSQFGAYCLNNGISPSQLTDNILKLFNEKANAKGEVKTEAQWCLYLAKYLKTCLNNPPPTTTPKQQIQTPPQASPVTTFKKDETPKKTKAERMAMFEKMNNLAGVK